MASVIFIIFFTSGVIYMVIISNPLNAWHNTYNKEFAKMVFINQFKMNEFEFAHWEDRYCKEHSLY